jgi:DNA repair protein RecO (recombination protein O)
VKQNVTKGIILSRTDFGEADRIITVLTPEAGKLRLMAKGVRKIKSKLAGGIELFSVSDLTYISGRGDIGTLISSRLDKHFGRITQNIDRVQLGYQLILQLNKVTEDHVENEYFDLLEQAFEGLDDNRIGLDLIVSWFEAQLLTMAGHKPNLSYDTEDNQLEQSKRYNFDIENMTFVKYNQGKFNSNDIKLLRLLFSNNSLLNLSKIETANVSLNLSRNLIRSMIETHIT